MESRGSLSERSAPLQAQPWQWRQCTATPHLASQRCLCQPACTTVTSTSCSGCAGAKGTFAWEPSLAPRAPPGHIPCYTIESGLPYGSSRQPKVNNEKIQRTTLMFEMNRRLVLRMEVRSHRIGRPIVVLNAAHVHLCTWVQWLEALKVLNESLKVVIVGVCDQHMLD
jgi:hypothetical protein